MSPKELKSLMARTRTSSPMLAEALGIAPQQIRKWRAGTRPVPERHISAMRLLFRERAESLGLEPRSLPEIPERVDPRQIVPAPIEHRIAIEARDDPLPAADGASMVEIIQPPCRRPGAAPACRFKACACPRCDRSAATVEPVPPGRSWPVSNYRRHAARAAAGTVFGAALPLAAYRRSRRTLGPVRATGGARRSYCALHWVQHVQQRQSFG